MTYKSMGTTKAQRLNKSYDRIWETYKQQEAARKDILPTCTDYSFFLGKAVEKLKITIDEARSKYGQYTYGQWKELLQLA
jgi:hypothetical protein